MREKGNPRVVAIIGGGFSGAVVAARLAAQLAPSQVRIIVFEPRDHLGCGLAYDTNNPSHRINVPADRMSLDRDNDLDFLAWLGRQGALSHDPAAVMPDGRVFPRRGLFGKYVSDFVAPFILTGSVRHVRQRVVHVLREGSSWCLETEDGSWVHVDLLVIATSHPAPVAPLEFAVKLADHPRLVRDTTVPQALDTIRQHDRVLVVGTGLTAADVIATLDAKEHRGAITFFSRRGLRSRGHPRVIQEAFGNIGASPPETALGLLRLVRAHVSDAGDRGLSWHAVFDALRSDAGTIWRVLPIRERQKLVRHLRPFWDVHRFRIAPQVEDIIDSRVAAGNLRLLVARAIEVERSGDEILVTLKQRHSQGLDRSAYDAVVVTTGPAHGGILASQPWLAAMARDGLIELDPTGLGLACDDASRATVQGRQVTPGVFVSGPLARGTFGELMGLPQVSDHATLVADYRAKAVVKLLKQEAA